jgi:gamma-glutamyltranspeptidase/glutathione hydrolase
MVVATSGSRAVRAAVDALEQGGSAADAAMITVLGQIALAAGAWVSYAGIMSMLYYEARTGRVHCLNAGFKTPRNEHDPLSIPRPGTPSGRTALVPGLMAGVHAAHERFGRLPFRSLFDPAIRIAERGFAIDLVLHRLLQARKNVLTRLPEGRATFLRKDGRLYRRGQRFKQPLVARTLRRVAARGVAYMYGGEWARRLVRIVRSQGGKLSTVDLERYKAAWRKPIRTLYHGYEVCGPGLPGYGGVHTVEALNLLEHARLRELGHYARSPAALYWMMQITQAAYAPWYRNGRSRVRKTAATRRWNTMRRRAPSSARVPSPRPQPHSDAVVAVDGEGNIAAVCHSINTVAWGTTGIFVDGVSIPDSACFQQTQVKETGPGRRLPEPMNPLIVLQAKRPVLASSAIGTALHEITIQCLVDVLDFGMSPGAAVEGPHFMGPVWVERRLGSHGKKKPPRGADVRQAVEREHFPKRILNAVQALGQRIQIADAWPLPGYWAAIQIDRGGATLRGAVTSRLHDDVAAAAGY